MTTSIAGGRPGQAAPGRRRSRPAPGGGDPVNAVPAAETLPVVADPAYPSEQERYYFASQWQLIWWRLRRHRFAMLSFWFLVVLYGMIPFVEFLAPYELRSRHPDYVYSPPQRVRLLRGLVLVHTGQSQPMAGTPTLVPVPRKTRRPVMSRLRGRRDTGADF